MYIIYIYYIYYIYILYTIIYYILYCIIYIYISNIYTYIKYQYIYNIMHIMHIIYYILYIIYYIILYFIILYCIILYICDLYVSLGENEERLWTLCKKKVVQVVCEHPPRFMGKNNMKLNDSKMYHQYSHRNLTWHPPTKDGESSSILPFKCHLSFRNQSRTRDSTIQRSVSV